MKDLILVGGAKGVGKTVVLKKVLEILPIGIVNTGKIYTSAIERGENSEKAIFDFPAILQSCKNILCLNEITLLSY